VAAGRSTTTPSAPMTMKPGFKFDRHYFVPGEYVSVTEHDGVMRTFRIIWVRDLCSVSKK
jgi:hypothetical protein